MASLKIEQLDHHGLVAGIIDELKLVEILDRRLPGDERDTVSAGEAVKAMIIVDADAAILSEPADGVAVSPGSVVEPSGDRRLYPECARHGA